MKAAQDRVVPGEAGPGELLMHAELKIGDSVVMLCDEMHGWNSGAHPMSCSIS